jgi:hypothetical protein
MSEMPGMAGMDEPGPAFAPTFAQQAALSGVTGLMLAAGMVLPAFSVNFR